METLGLSDGELNGLLKRGWHSEVFIPLVSGDEVLGYIDVYAAETRDWTTIADLVGGVGQLVAGALEKAELLHRLENGNRELRALADNSLEFGSTLDMDRVLISIARRMRATVDATACDIYSVEGDVLRALLAVNDEDVLDPDVARNGASARRVPPEQPRASQPAAGRREGPGDGRAGQRAGAPDVVGLRASLGSDHPVDPRRSGGRDRGRVRP